MLDKWRKLHIDRVIETTNNLYKQKHSICKKCHKMDNINCLFCYCPLYEDENCGGNYIILENGLKDCSKCTLPHTEEFVRRQLLFLYETQEDKWKQSNG